MFILLSSDSTRNINDLLNSQKQMNRCLWKFRPDRQDTVEKKRHIKLD